MEVRNGEPNFYVFFTPNFTNTSFESAGSWQDMLSRHDTPSQGNVAFSEVHLRYCPDGDVHLQFKKNGKVVKGVPPHYAKHEPLATLTPAKRIFGIIPVSIDQYPI